VVGGPGGRPPPGAEAERQEAEQGGRAVAPAFFVRSGRYSAGTRRADGQPVLETLAGTRPVLGVPMGSRYSKPWPVLGAHPYPSTPMGLSRCTMQPQDVMVTW